MTKQDNKGNGGKNENIEEGYGEGLYHRRI